MSVVRAKSLNGPMIRSIQEWYSLAPPKKPLIQWKDFRSAKELAQAWLRSSSPAMPVEYSELLRSHELTRNFVVENAFAEAKIRIDEFRNPRNSDMVVIGKSKRHPILLAIEAKADEEYADRIEDELKGLTANSNKPERVERLTAAVFARSVDQYVMSIRYQLLHSLAATAIEARKHQAKLGVLLIHEFISLKLDFEKVTENASDLKTFVRMVPGWENEVIVTGKLLPPIRLTGNKHVPNDQLVTIGKARTLIPLDAEGREQAAAGFIRRERQFLVPSPSTLAQID